MMFDIHEFDDAFTETFTIFKKSTQLGTVRGFFIGSNHEIQLEPSDNIDEGNILIHQDGKKYILDEVNPLPENCGYMVRYETEYSKSQHSPQISIGTVNGGASIGDNNHNVFNSNSNDLSSIKTLLDSYSDIPVNQKDELLDLLKVTESSNLPMSKGFLSKFEAIFKKHSDLGVAVGIFIVKLLTNLL